MADVLTVVLAGMAVITMITIVVLYGWSKSKKGKK